MTRILLATIVTFATALILSACGGSSGTGSSSPATTSVSASQAAAGVKADLTEWKIATPTTAKAGPVTFTVANSGKVPHELVVVQTDKPAAELGTGNRVSEKGSVGEAGDVPVGGSKSVTLKLKPGHYALICNLPGHYKLGMHADLTVR